MITSTSVTSARKKAVENAGTGEIRKIGDIGENNKNYKNGKNDKNKDKSENLETNLIQILYI